MKLNDADVSYDSKNGLIIRLPSQANILCANSQAVQSKAPLFEQLSTAVAVQQTSLLLLLLALKLEERRLPVEKGF